MSTRNNPAALSSGGASLSSDGGSGVRVEHIVVFLYHAGVILRRFVTLAVGSDPIQ